MRTRTCDNCGETFTAKRKDARTCSPNCRKAIQRAKATASQPIEPRLAGAVSKLDTASRVLLKLSADSRFPAWSASMSGKLSRSQLEESYRALGLVLEGMQTENQEKEV